MKKELKKWLTDNGYKFSYSGHAKTFYVYNYLPGTVIDIPFENLEGISIVGLEPHKIR